MNHIPMISYDLFAQILGTPFFCPLKSPTFFAASRAFFGRTQVVGMLSGIKDDTNEEIKVETDSEELEKLRNWDRKRPTIFY